MRWKTFLPERAGILPLRALKSALLAAALAMYGYSWRVWTGQGLFPAIPFFSFIPYLGQAASCMLFGFMLLSLALCLPGGRERWLWGHLAAWTLLVLQDQNRFQPWSYQFMLCAIALSAAPGKEAAGLLRVLTSSIYLYSGLQKLDKAFIERTGSYLLTPLLRPFDLQPENLPASALATLALSMGTVECLAAVGLLARRSRPYAAALSILMHLVILYCIGPWGLRYNAVVWPWNIFMMFCVAVLFTPLLSRGEPAPETAPSPRIRLCYGAFAAALSFPLLKFVGIADAYPSFALYSDRIEDSRIFIRWEASQSLPDAVKKRLNKPAADRAGRVWTWLNDSDWSLAELGVPGYPQHRFHAGVALGLCARFDLEDDLLLEHYGQPGILSGKKSMRGLEGCQEVCRDPSHYWLNARPANAPYKNFSTASFLAGCAEDSRWSRYVEEGLLAHKQGRDDEAQKLLLSAVQEARASGSDLRMARSLELLGALAMRRRRYADAETLYRSSLSIWERARGAQDPKTAARISALALAAASQRRYAQAEPLYRRSLEIYEKTLGPQHPRTALALNYLAETLLAQGRRAEAKALYLRALRIHQKTFPDHPDAAFGLSRLASIYVAEGNPAQAKRLDSQAKAIRDRNGRALATSP